MEGWMGGKSNPAQHIRCTCKWRYLEWQEYFGIWYYHCCCMPNFLKTALIGPRSYVPKVFQKYFLHPYLWLTLIFSFIFKYLTGTELLVVRCPSLDVRLDENGVGRGSVPIPRRACTRPLSDCYEDIKRLVWERCDLLWTLWICCITGEFKKLLSMAQEKFRLCGLKQKLYYRNSQSKKISPVT